MPDRIKNAWQRGKLQGEIANLLPVNASPSDYELEEISNIINISEQIPISEEARKLQEEGISWAFKNPLQGSKAIGEVILESLSAQLKASERTTPAAVGIGATAGTIVPGIGTGVGALTGITAGQITAGMNLETSGKVLSVLKEAGIDARNGEELKAAFGNPELMDKARDLAIKRGIPIAVIDLLTAGIASRVAGGAARTTLGRVGRISSGLGIEALGGSAGELAAQVASGENIDPNAIALEGIAEIGSGAPTLVSETAKNVILKPREQTSSSNNNIVTQIANDPETGVIEAKQNLNGQLQEGLISDEDHKDGMDYIDRIKDYESKIPTKVEGVKRKESIELISEREFEKSAIEGLEQEKKNIDEAYHARIDEDIKNRKEKVEGINTKLQEIYNESPVQEETISDTKQLEEIETQFKNEKEQQNGNVQDGQENGQTTQDERRQQEGGKNGQEVQQEEVGGKDATEIRDQQQDDQQQYKGTAEQQQGQQENRVNQEEPISEGEAETSDSNISGEGREVEEKITGIAPMGTTYGAIPKGVSNEFHELATKNIESTEERKSLTNILNVSDYELKESDKTYLAKTDIDSASHGNAVVDKAKEEFGNNYVEDTVKYLDTAKMSQDKRSLIYIALELDLEKQLSEDPENLGLKKKLEWLRGIVVKEQRSAALAVGHGRLRNIIKYGFDIDTFFNEFYSPEQREGKNKVKEAIESDIETIQNEYENQQAELESDAGEIAPDIEAAIQEGVDKRVNEIYEALPSKRREKADKAIAALDKIQKKLRSKTYDASIGVPIAIIDAGITTIKAAIKAGVSVADAVELGINKIKEKHGKAWAKESQFRKDMLDGFKTEGIELTGGKRIMSPEQRRKLYIKQLEKSITGLDEQIEAGKKKVVTKGDKYKNDEEVNKLREIKKSKQDELAKIDPSYAERRKLETDLKTAQKSLDEWERKVKDNDFTPAEKQQGNVDKKLKELRDKRDKARDEYHAKKKAYEDSLITPEQKEQAKIQSRVDQIKKSIDNLTDKLNGKEVTKNDSSLWTKEIGELEQERERLKKELTEKRKADKLPVEPKELVPLTPSERLANAKKLTQARIDGIRQEILNKERELKTINKPIQGDAELQRLKAEETALKSLRDKYLPKEESGYNNAKKLEARANKLLKEIEAINKQIKESEKAERASKKDPLTNEKINILKAEKAARLVLLDQLDPNPKETIKQALIEAGYSRETTVKTKEGKVKKTVFDWTKLAGSEKSIDKIRDNVRNYLEGKGYSEGDIIRIEEGFIDEYNQLLADIIEKSQTALESKNKPPEGTTGKTVSRRLAELYNYGLFEKEADTYDYLINSALGINEFSKQQFAQLRKLASALSESYSSKNETGRVINEFGLKHAVRNINHEITKLMTSVAWNESPMSYKVAVTISEIANLMQRSLLNTVKQIIDNPVSGWAQRGFTKLGFAFEKINNKELQANKDKIGRAVYTDIVQNGGLSYGDISSPYINRSAIIEKMEGFTTNKIYHTILSAFIGKAHLDAADSFHKIALVETYFRHNVIKLLSDSSNPNRISKEEALHFVNEKLTGQSFENAKSTAKDIIDKINKKAGKTVVPTTNQSILRLASDLVKESLLEGSKQDIKSIEGAYKAAYRAAGLDLGHEANNIISLGLSSFSSFMDKRISLAMKGKKYNEAAALIFANIINRNLMNPFVGGAMNWKILKLQKTGLDPISPLYNWYRSRDNKLDLSTNEGVRNVENALTRNLATRNSATRVIIGAMASLLVFAASKATDKDEELAEWVKKNEWAKKYFSAISPEVLVGILAEHNNELGEYFKKLIIDGRTESMDAIPKLIKGTQGVVSGRQAKVQKGWGLIGQAIGSKISTPIIPWRIIKDFHNIYNGLEGLPPVSVDYTSQSFANGLFQAGFIDYIGLRPKDDAIDVDLREIKQEGEKEQVIYELNDEQLKEREKFMQEFDKEYGEQIKAELKRIGASDEQIEKDLKRNRNRYSKAMIMAKYYKGDGTLNLKVVSRKDKTD